MHALTFLLKDSKEPEGVTTHRQEKSSCTVECRRISGGDCSYLQSLLLSWGLLVLRAPASNT